MLGGRLFGIVTIDPQPRALWMSDGTVTPKFVRLTSCCPRRCIDGQSCSLTTEPVIGVHPVERMTLRRVIPHSCTIPLTFTGRVSLLRAADARGFPRHMEPLVRSFSITTLMFSPTDTSYLHGHYYILTDDRECQAPAD
jgi:hypothetical protein